MTDTSFLRRLSAVLVLSAAVLAPMALAQPSESATPAVTAPARPQVRQVTSPEVSADRKVTFRLLAPQADKVRLMGGDIPNNNQGAEMTKDENGVWQVTLGPLPPGAYRYNFSLNGVNVLDPRNPSVSESNNNAWSLVPVPGSPLMDTRKVPHGAVAAVTYYSTSLDRPRRMHIYTPPGYEANGQKYPVFYLLHGASDSDDSWSSVGRAGFILDNLLADQKAKPMIVVMPAGHTRYTNVPGSAAAGDEFVKDFVTDIMPYVEKNYRTINDRPHRAIAGLSMGGSQTLNIAIPHLDQFAYIGVFSSGMLGMFPSSRPGAPAMPRPTGPNWEEQNMAALDNAGWKKGLKLFWFGIGTDDFLLNSNRSSVALLKKHGFTPVAQESAGGHTWLNWRDYLVEFTPQLFQ